MHRLPMKFQLSNASFVPRNQTENRLISACSILAQSQCSPIQTFSSTPFKAPAQRGRERASCALTFVALFQCLLPSAAVKVDFEHFCVSLVFQELPLPPSLLFLVSPPTSRSCKLQVLRVFVRFVGHIRARATRCCCCCCRRRPHSLEKRCEAKPKW